VGEENIAAEEKRRSVNVNADEYGDLSFPWAQGFLLNRLSTVTSRFLPQQIDRVD
jgi:hypothetical protein